MPLGLRTAKSGEGMDRLGEADGVGQCHAQLFAASGDLQKLRKASLPLSCPKNPPADPLSRSG